MIRVGQGYDLHRLEPGRPLVLGGVTVPFDKGLDGHSDADVVTHAIIDALLGACALGNIGQLFPDTDPAFRGANSLKLLEEVVRRIEKSGYSIGNVDATIVAEAPKLNPYLLQMCDRIAQALNIEPDLVSIKAKTNERVGPEGRGEAISAHAIAVVERAP
jgi:2-C-methyl-D-erythritol 2,4-cyclodiphosphate synthase